MKAEKKPQVPIKHDIVLTLSPEEAKALFHIVEDFDKTNNLYRAGADDEQFDVVLLSELLELGVNRE